MRELPYSPPLDGLRSICIILTLLQHVENVPSLINGTVGVDVFFPLSGFLITSILLRCDWADLKGYYIRRFFRIAPVYYLSLTLTALFTVILHDFAIAESKLTQLYNVLLPSLLFSRELATDVPTLFGQAWTVGIEEKFYLAWPIFFLILSGNARRIVFLVAIFMLVIATGKDFLVRGYGGIALGCISAVLYVSRGFYIKTSVAVGCITVAYFFCLYFDLWFENLIISFAATLLIPSLYAMESHLSRFLSHPIMVTLGKLTFSIYMFHVLVFFTIKFVLKKFGIDYWLVVFILGYIFTIVFSFIVYKFFEYPLILYGKRLSTSR